MLSETALPEYQPSFAYALNEPRTAASSYPQPRHIHRFRLSSTDFLLSGLR